MEPFYDSPNYFGRSLKVIFVYFTNKIHSVDFFCAMPYRQHCECYANHSSALRWSLLLSLLMSARTFTWSSCGATPGTISLVLALK